MQVLGEQGNLVEADIDQSYADWFIETCQDWVVPYIGDLVGYTSTYKPGEAGADTSAEGQARGRILFPRRDMANTLADRRRKGTLALLERIAMDVAGWPARAVEFYTLLRVDQSLNHLRLSRGQSVDLRKMDALDRLYGPFDEFSHTVGIGGGGDARSVRRFNIPNIGLFAWRLQPYAITDAPALCVDRVRNQYTFSALGNDAPLITLPVSEPDPNSIAGEINVPAFIRRRAFEERMPDYYGHGKSLQICIRPAGGGPLEPVSIQRIVAADLTDWGYTPQRDQVAVDPVLGRINFSTRNAPDGGVWVSYQYGFSADLGGGEYHRPLTPIGDRAHYVVQRGEKIMDAVQKWQADRDADPTKARAVIEIEGSGVWREQMRLELKEGDRLELRAAQGSRPVIRLLDWENNQPDEFRVMGVPWPAAGQAAPACDASPDEDKMPRLVLNGLLITGRSMRVTDRLSTLVIVHCTLVPGWSLEQDCKPRHEEEDGLESREHRGRRPDRSQHCGDRAGHRR